MFTYNTVILTNDLRNYGTLPCYENNNSYPLLSNNYIGMPNGNIYKNYTGLCNYTVNEFQNKYNNDCGTIIGPLLDDKVLLDKAHDLLWD